MIQPHWVRRPRYGRPERSTRRSITAELGSAANHRTDAGHPSNGPLVVETTDTGNGQGPGRDIGTSRASEPMSNSAALLARYAHRRVTRPQFAAAPPAPANLLARRGHPDAGRQADRFRAGRGRRRCRLGGSRLTLRPMRRGRRATEEQTEFILETLVAHVRTQDHNACAPGVGLLHGSCDKKCPIAEDRKANGHAFPGEFVVRVPEAWVQECNGGHF